LIDFVFFLIDWVILFLLIVHVSLVERPSYI